MKRSYFNEGDYFSIPLVDGSECIGQVLSIEPKALNSVVCSIYADRYSNEIAEWTLPKQLISVQFVTPDLLKSGVWKILGNDQILKGMKFAELEMCRNNKFVGTKIRGSGIIKKLLEAFHGLRPWDSFHDPAYLDKLLLSGVARPDKVILEKD